MERVRKAEKAVNDSGGGGKDRTDKNFTQEKASRRVYQEEEDNPPYRAGNY